VTQLDRTLEILCSLSTTPAQLETIRADFGLPNQGEVRKYLKHLRDKHGVRTEIYRSEADGYVVEVPAAAWPFAKGVAEAYWGLTHEGEPPAPC
jgi:hypothetical protein